MTAWKPFYRIKSGKDGGSGSFLSPPGHPRHSYSLYGYESARHRNAMSISAIDNALADDFDGSDAIKARVQEIMDDATFTESEMWVRMVYAYFRDSYAPEPKPGEAYDRNTSSAVIHNPTEIAVNATRKALADEYGRPGVLAGLTAAEENYRDGSERPMRAARRGWEVTATRNGSEVFVYALADDGSRYGMLHVLQDHAAVLEEAGFTDVRIEDPQTRDGVFIPERVRATVPVKIEPLDPNRHLAVLCIREYFPDHEPRLDLIENPGKGYGAYPCTKCGEKVQYEARTDKQTKVSARIDGTGMTHWSYATECLSGGDHEV